MKQLVLSMKVLPPTLNDIITSARRNKFASATLKKKWTASIREAARVQNVGRLSGEVYLECVWRVKNRRRDQDNITAAQKYILDGLVDAQTIEEDNLKTIRTPIIHHVVVTDHDGFSIFIRDKEALTMRILNENILEPPYVDVAAIPEIKLSGQRPSSPSRQRATSTRQQKAARKPSRFRGRIKSNSTR